jgi:4-amino-4-deoxy-L-arabinose transferase-like glycosyltransferase
VRPERRNVLVLAALAAIVGFAFQGSRGLYETTEGRYAESAREMLETGSWLVPRLDYAPHWTKPPLAYWTIAGGMALFGTNEWGARLPNAALFVLTALALGALGGAMWDRRTGFAAGLVWAVSPFAVLAASSVHTDLLLSFWELLAVLCWWKAHRADGPRSAKRWILGMWGLFGVAFLTKGPPALVVLAAILAFRIYLAATGRKGPRLLPLPGVALMIVVGSSWYVAVAAKTPGLLDYFLGTEVYARIATGAHGRNPEWYKPLVIFVPPLLFGTGAGLGAWIVALARERALFGWSSLARRLRDDERLAFLAIWLLVPLVIFSLAKSRLPFYVLPIFPAVALATARMTLRAIDRRGLARAAIVAAIVSAAALVGLKGASAGHRSDLDMRALHRACLDAKRGETAFFLFGSRELFGLQFYLDGRLTRLADAPLPPWARRSLDSVCHEIVAAPRHETYVFVTADQRRADELRKRLDDLGMSYVAGSSGSRYVLFTCRAVSPSSNLAAASPPAAAPGRNGPP